MRKVSFVIVLAWLLSGVSVQAQRISRLTSGFDVGTGYLDKEWAPSFLYYQLINPPRQPWLRLGWGMRGWGYYTTRNTSFLAPNGTGGQDTLRLGQVSANGLSFALVANVRLGRVDIGVNADLISLALGKKRNGLYVLSDLAMASDSARKYHGTLLPTAPRNLNTLPFIFKNVNGQAEAYVRIWFNEQIGLKLGYVVGQTAYRLDQRLNNDQRYFGKGFGMPYAALAFPVFSQ